MAAGGHFGCPKITFDRISGYFRSICNFFLIDIFLQNGHRRPFCVGQQLSIIELVRDIWMSNACVKFDFILLNVLRPLFCVDEDDDEVGLKEKPEDTRYIKKITSK